MASTSPASIRASYKSAFLKGLAAILPTFLTIYILLATYGFVDETFARPLNVAMKGQLTGTFAGRELAVRFLRLDPELLRAGREVDLAKAVDQAFPEWVGFVAAFSICFVVGFFIASFVGGRMWSAAERTILRIPIVKAIYPSAKQITDFFIASDEQSQRFSRVVVVPFPLADQYSVGFVMADGLQTLDEKAGEKLLSIFVPMSPTPVTGFVVLVPESRIIGIDMSVDEAFKYYLTCGLAIPPRLASKPAAPATAAAPTKPA